MAGPGSDSGPQLDDEMQDEYDLNPSAAQAPPGGPATPQREAVGVVGVGHNNYGAQVLNDSPAVRDSSVCLGRRE